MLTVIKIYEKWMIRDSPICMKQICLKLHILSVHADDVFLTVYTKACAHLSSSVCEQVILTLL